MWKVYVSAFIALIITTIIVNFDNFSIITSLENFLLSSDFEHKRIFTKYELTQFNGIEHEFLYLSILGNIFNVTKSFKHYGPGQQYNYFVGRDASRSFITGKFDEKEARDDVIDFDKEDLRSLNHWLKFYKKEYQKIGKLIGRYYDKFGQLTPYGKQVKKLIHSAEETKKQNDNEMQKFPPCNIEWNPDKGSRLWCTNKSGGIERAWIGKPRMFYEIGSTAPRCVCVNDENLQTENIKQYPNCDSDSVSCYVE